MKPSAKMRNFIMKISSPNFLKNIFIIMGIISIIIIGIVMILIGGPNSDEKRIEKLQKLQENNVTIIDNGNESGVLEYITDNGTHMTINYGDAFVMCIVMMAVFGVTFIIIVPLFIKLIVKFMQIGIVIPETNNEKVDFHTLCQDCLEIGNNSPYVAVPYENEGWIDVSCRWKDSTDVLIPGINKNTQIFYKLFKVYPDYTYTDIDMVTTVETMLGLRGIKLGKSVFLGHIQTNKIETTLSKPENGNLGIHRYELNTTEMTNYMHKWFAVHGYKYKKWI